MAEPSDAASDEGDTNPYQTVGKGGITVILGTGVGILFSFLTKTASASLLGSEKYGLLVLGIATINTVYLAAQMGLPIGIARNLPRFDSAEDKRGIVLSALTLSLPVGIVLTVLLIVFSGRITNTIFQNPDMEPILKTFAVLVPIIALQHLSINVFRGYKQSHVRVIVRDLINPVARFVLITGAILLGYGVAGAAIGWVVGVSLAAFYGAYLLYRDTPILTFDRFEPHYKTLLLFSLPLLVSSMSQTVLLQADSILLGVFSASSSRIGVYDISFTISRLITWALFAFNFLFVPVFSELHEKGDTEEMDRLFKIVTKWIVLITLPVYGLLVLYPGTILSVIGEGYEAGATSLILLSTGYFVNTFLGLGKMSLVSIGHTRSVMLGDFGTAILNVGLNVVLIPRFGIVGAATASAISYAGFNAFYTYLLFREHGIHPFTEHLLKPAIVGFVAVLGVHSLVTNTIAVTYVVLPVLGITFACVYLVSFLYLGGVQRQDLEVVRTVNSKVKIDLSVVEGHLRKFMK